MSLLCAAIPATLAKGVVGRSINGRGTSRDVSGDFVDYTHATFARHLNTTFRVRTDSSSFALKLTKVTDLKTTAKTPEKIAGRESFSLLFVGPGDSALPQETYTIEHAALGKFSLFLVPVGKGVNATKGHHEAIVIRL